MKRCSRLFSVLVISVFANSVAISEDNEVNLIVAKKLLPMSQLRERIREIHKNNDQEILIICNTQYHSNKTVEALTNTMWKNSFGRIRYI